MHASARMLRRHLGSSTSMWKHEKHMHTPPAEKSKLAAKLAQTMPARLCR